MNLLVGDLETSDSNVNSLSVLEASFCLYDDRFREIELLSMKAQKFDLHVFLV